MLSKIIITRQMLNKLILLNKIKSHFLVMSDHETSHDEECWWLLPLALFCLS